MERAGATAMLHGPVVVAPPGTPAEDVLGVAAELVAAGAGPRRPRRRRHHLRAAPEPRPRLGPQRLHPGSRGGAAARAAAGGPALGLFGWRGGTALWSTAGAAAPAPPSPAASTDRPSPRDEDHRARGRHRRRQAAPRSRRLSWSRRDLTSSSTPATTPRSGACTSRRTSTPSRYTLGGVHRRAQGLGPHRRDLPRPRPDRALRRAGLVQPGRPRSGRPTSTAPRLLREGRIPRPRSRARSPRPSGVAATVLPMSDQPVRTRILGPDGWLAFQEYFVREKAQVEVRAVKYAGAPAARPAPGVLEAIARRRRGPRVPLEPDHLHRPDPGRSRARRGAAVHARRSWSRSARSWAATRCRGPAGRLMAAAGLPVSATGVARAYGGWLDLLVFDEQDRTLAPEIRAAGRAPGRGPHHDVEPRRRGDAGSTRGRRARGGAGCAMSRDRGGAGQGPRERQAAARARPLARRAARAGARDAGRRARSAGGGAPRLRGGDHHGRGGPGPGPRRGRRVLDRERQPGPHRGGGLRPAAGRRARRSRASSRSPATCPASPPTRWPRSVARSTRHPGSSSCRRGPASAPTPSLLAPPGAMPLTFGEPSFANHLAAARAAGLAPRVLELPGIGLDVDAPDDLPVLLERGPPHPERPSAPVASPPTAPRASPLACPPATR